MSRAIHQRAKRVRVMGTRKDWTKRGGGIEMSERSVGGKEVEGRGEWRGRGLGGHGASGVW